CRFLLAEVVSDKCLMEGTKAALTACGAAESLVGWFRPQKQARTDRIRYLTRMNMKKRTMNLLHSSWPLLLFCEGEKTAAHRLPISSSCGPLRIAVSLIESLLLKSCSCVFRGRQRELQSGCGVAS
ncbi:hypothetical protein S83_022519, partial [Arachis hypogaea]